MNNLTSESGELNPLGNASPLRYQKGAWPTALLNRMAYWTRRMHSKGELLDLGCGEGALLEAINMNGFGADLNPERLALSVKKNLPVVLATGEQLPFSDGTFQTVISMEVLEHVPKMEVMLKDVRRVLNEGGVWVVSVPSVTLRSRYEMWREKRPYYCDSDEHYREFSAVLLGGFEHRFMLTSEFKKMFEDYDFDVIQQDGVRYLFPQWLNRFPFLQKKLESPEADRFWSAVPWFRKFPYWTILILRKRALP